MSMINIEIKQQSWLQRLRYGLLGRPKNIHDPSIFHKLALIPALAWIGLGADGLSSASYGPEEAFKVLGEHGYLAILLALLSMFTIFVISYSYTQIIEEFPIGGGGYVVATKTLGNNAGVISGCALLIDYILTITVSIASCGNALFSFLPNTFDPLQIPFDIMMISFLIILNMRGIKESITILVPIFVIFVITHILLIIGGICWHLPQAHTVIKDLGTQLHSGVNTLGWIGILSLILKAYSLGAGTYTGIEAVSNGLQVMKEPKVKTAKTTMMYMALSLAFAAGGIFACYVLLDIKPVEGKTLNAVLASKVFGSWEWLAVVTIVSEGALLLVGAQTGFIDGPRIMANMAADKWMPRHLANLSEHLTMRNGILLIGIPAIILLLITDADVSALVVMYSINVFLTFSLSQLGMCKHFWQNKLTMPKWRRSFSVNFIGLILCFTILCVTIKEKFSEGGYVTLCVTFATIILCYLMHGYYRKIQASTYALQLAYEQNMPSNFVINTNPLNRRAMTAIYVVHEFNGLGINIFFTILKQFPNLYENIIFISVAKVDSSSFSSMSELKQLESNRINDLKQYVALARANNIPATYYFKTSTNPSEGTAELCLEATTQFPKSTVFMGILQLKHEAFYHKFLHSHFPYLVERRLQHHGVTTVILPIKTGI